MSTWMHRISQCGEAAYPLFEAGYLSIGYSDMAADAGFASGFRSAAGTDERWEGFEAANRRCYGEKPGRARYFLWHFLYDFGVGARIVVPRPGEFAVCKTVGLAKPIGCYLEELKRKGLEVAPSEHSKNLVKWNGNEIDLGFLIPVEQLLEFSPRASYLEKPVFSRLKYQGTNVSMDDLERSLDESVAAVREGRSLYFMRDGIEALVAPLMATIRKLPPDRLEALVRCYLRKIGADDAVKPPSHGSGKADTADADVAAIFNALSLEVDVQVKQHEGETSKWAVEQITEYGRQRGGLGGGGDDACHTRALWVVSMGDTFSGEARRLAEANNVRLIDGAGFARMVLDAGLANICGDLQ